MFVLNKSTRIIFHFLLILDSHTRDIWMPVCIFCFFLLHRRLWFLLNFSHPILSICIHFIMGPLQLLCMGTSEFDLYFTKLVIRTQLIECKILHFTHGSGRVHVPCTFMNSFPSPGESCEKSGSVALRRWKLLEQWLFSLLSTVSLEHFVKTHHTSHICSFIWTRENSFSFKIFLNQAHCCCLITSQRSMPVFPLADWTSQWPTIILHFTLQSHEVCTGLLSTPAPWKQWQSSLLQLTVNTELLKTADLLSQNLNIKKGTHG